MNGLLPTSEVLKRLCIGRTMLYEWIKQELMTPSIPLTKKTVVWPESEVQAVIDSIIAGDSPQVRRAMIKSLIASRSRLRAA